MKRRSLDKILAAIFVAGGLWVAVPQVNRIVQEVRQDYRLINAGGVYLNSGQLGRLFKEISYKEIDPEFDLSKVTKAIWYDKSIVVGDPEITDDVMKTVNVSYDLVLMSDKELYREFIVDDRPLSDGAIDSYGLFNFTPDRKLHFFIDGRVHFDQDPGNVDPKIARRVSQAFFDASREVFGNHLVERYKFTRQQVSAVINGNP